MGNEVNNQQGVFGNIPPAKFYGTADYQSILEVLYQYNKASLDTSNSKFIDLNRDSPNKYLRSVLDELTKPKIIPKDEVLGVVLKVVQFWDTVSEKYVAKVYVDVPQVGFEGVSHQDIFFNPTIKNTYTDWEHKAFYVDENTLKKLPKRGDIVKVKLAPDYPAHSNPRDNRYIGVFKDSAVLPSNNKKLVINAKKATNLTLETRRESLTSEAYKPSEITEEDYIGLPYKGIRESTGKPFQISSFPSIRTPPENGAAKFLGKEIDEHIALDIGMDIGTPVYSVAAHSLKVVRNTTLTNNDKPSYGLHIVGENDKYKFIYAHLSDISFDPDTTIETEKGIIIGYSGDTGARPKSPMSPHLHFEMREKQTNRKINPLYFIKGAVELVDTFVNAFGFKDRFLKLPLALDARYDDYRYFSEINETFQREPNPIKTDIDYGEGGAGQFLVPRSAPATPKRLLLVDFETDFAKGVTETTKRGSKNIKVREDILMDLKEIKQILNNYGISFTMINQNPSYENNNLTFMAKVGLEIKLNNNAALQKDINNNISDYLVGPDYSKPLGYGYKLKIYAPIKRDVVTFDRRYVPELKTFDIYDISDTYLTGKPRIIKITKKILDLTKIFEDYGFKQIQPKQDFFLKSDVDKSNWFYFFKPNKIIKGYTYKDLLETVYDTNKVKKPFSVELKWDGDKFT
jgi:murein DD-endopeptidase MepM/ murein hydrolase activator NlpD